MTSTARWSAALLGGGNDLRGRMAIETRIAPMQLMLGDSPGRRAVDRRDRRRGAGCVP